MAEAIEFFNEMKRFVDFTDTDAANLKSLAPVFAKHGGTITDKFYETLGNFPSTAKLIEGRVDALKATHGRWMGELFAGSYGEDYLQNRIRIGHAHVRIGLDPQYVEGVMTHLRNEGLRAIHEELGDTEDARAKGASLVRILDLDLAIINFAYAEERLDRVSNFTGMSRRLIETVVRKGGKR